MDKSNPTFYVQFLAVVICLQKEYPREKEFAERRNYYAQMLAEDPDEISEFFKQQQAKSDYKNLISLLEDLLPENFLLIPSRLNDLLSQCKGFSKKLQFFIKQILAWETQVRNCSLHIGKPQAIGDNNSILRDHRCSTLNFPSKTVQVSQNWRLFQYKTLYLGY